MKPIDEKKFQEFEDVALTEGKTALQAALKYKGKDTAALNAAKLAMSALGRAVGYRSAQNNSAAIELATQKYLDKTTKK